MFGIAGTSECTTSLKGCWLHSVKKEELPVSLQHSIAALWQVCRSNFDLKVKIEHYSKERVCPTQVVMVITK